MSDQDLQELRKALDTSATNGNNVLDPVMLSRVISNQVRKQPRLRNILPRIPWNTNLYYWNTQTQNGADAVTSTDGGNLSYIDRAYSQSNATMSYFYYVELISNIADLAMAPLVDAMTFSVSEATKAILRKEGSAIFNGDPSNSSYQGLLTSLKASATYSYGGNGQTLTASLMDSMEMNLAQQGYEIDVWVVSQNAYQIMKRSAFNAVRFTGVSEGEGGAFGYSMLGQLQFNSKPVIFDPYACSVTSVNAETLTYTGSGATYDTYTFAHNPVNATGVANLTDQAGTSLPAPVITYNGSVVSAANYTIAANTLTFATSGYGTSHPCTATYSYNADNVFCLSLKESDIVVAELAPIKVDLDLGKPIQQDQTPFRVKEYNVMVVRNPLAHAVATNVVVPSTISGFIGS